MTVTVASFEADFNEFADYSVNKISFWLAAAQNFINPDEWGDLTDLGVELVVAHNIAIDKRNAIEASSGVPGSAVGPIASKAVGPVSASYDIGAGTVPDGGNWNLTNYGTRYLELRSLLGVGGLQATGCINPAWLYSGGWI